MTTPDRDYLLGTHDEEIERLGLQHRVWRARMLDGFARAGIGPGMTVIDAGAGPGWATRDLAEIVGPTGRVHALERSQRFLDHLQAVARRERLEQISSHALDLVVDDLPVRGADAVWIRWVLAFLPDPEPLLVKLAAALKPGGVAVIHEYLDYSAWSFAPASPEQAAFRDRVITGWRDSGGEPDAARALLGQLPRTGFRIREVRPMLEVVRPGAGLWLWALSFVNVYLDRLVAEGAVAAAWAETVRTAFARAEGDPDTWMVTPLVLEVIAEKI